MGDSDSDSDDFQFASPQAFTPTFTSAGPPLFPALKPPSFAAAPEDLPPSTSEPLSSTAFSSLSKILPTPLPLSAAAAAHSLSCLLRAPNSGSGDNPLCRWLYETFQSGDPALQLLVLRFVPLIAGVYLARASTQRRHLAGFEAILLALYSHRSSEPPIALTLPDLSSPSVYHEPSSTTTASETPSVPELVCTLPALHEAQGSVRATRRACIVGVALEVYYSKICWMPVASKVEFCEFVSVWAGHMEEGDMEERIAMPWELLEPALKIVGHCMMGPANEGGLRGRAHAACMKLRARALHDVDPKAILVIDTLLRMVEEEEEEEEADYTELPDTRILSI